MSISFECCFKLKYDKIMSKLIILRVSWFTLAVAYEYNANPPLLVPRTMYNVEATSEPRVFFYNLENIEIKQITQQLH